MQTLHVAQKSLNSIGFSPEQSRFSGKILSNFFIIFPTIILQWIFLFHEADGAQEYIECLYIVTSCTGVFLSFASTIFISTKFFSFFKSVDDFFNQSKMIFSFASFLNISNYFNYMRIDLKCLNKIRIEQSRIENNSWKHQYTRWKVE